MRRSTATAHHFYRRDRHGRSVRLKAAQVIILDKLTQGIALANRKGKPSCSSPLPSTSSCNGSSYQGHAKYRQKSLPSPDMGWHGTRHAIFHAVIMTVAARNTRATVRLLWPHDACVGTYIPGGSGDTSSRLVPATPSTTASGNHPGEHLFQQRRIFAFRVRSTFSPRLFCILIWICIPLPAALHTASP